MASPRPLTPKQLAFCREYVVDLNATQAAIRAGYSARTAAEIGAENLTKPQIAAEIARLTAAKAERAEVQATQVLAEADGVALSDIGDLFDLVGDRLALLPMKDWPADARRAVASVKVRQYPEKLPPLTESDFERLEAIASGKGFGFDVTRAIPAEDQAWLKSFVADLRGVYWQQFEILEVKLWDKPAALRLSMQHRGMLKDVVERHDKTLETLLRERAERRRRESAAATPAKAAK